MLDADAARQLGQTRSVPDWIARHRHRIPADLLPAAEDGVVDGAFAALLASFLQTSFRIEHVHFGDRLLATHLVRGVDPGRPPRRGMSSTLALALKHLLSAEGLAVTDDDMRGLARRGDLAEALTVWTYVWELDRRARGKGKGPVVHSLWRRLPPSAPGGPDRRPGMGSTPAVDHRCLAVGGVIPGVCPNMPPMTAVQIAQVFSDPRAWIWDEDGDNRMVMIGSTDRFDALVQAWIG